MMDFMELRRETTRFRRDAQYLPTEAKVGSDQEDVGWQGTLPPHPLIRVPRDLKDLLCDFENTQ